MRRGVMASSRVQGTTWSPLNYPNLIAWYDATDASTLTESGGLVSQWRDKSGSNLHMSQAVEAAMPTLGVNLWGVPTVQFDGNRLLSAGGGLDYPRPVTTVMVFTPKAASSAPLVLRPGSGLYMGRADVATRFNAWLANGQELILNGLVGMGIPVVATTIAATTPTPSLLRIDGGRRTGSVQFASTLGVTDILVGDVNTTPGSGLIGDVSEILVFARGLSAVEYAEIEQNLRAKYRTSLSSGWFSGHRLWLSARDIAGSEGSAVTTWRNLANNGAWNHVQTDPLKQPALTFDSGFPAVRFAAGDVLVNSGTQRGYTTTNSFFCVAKVGALGQMPLLGLNSGVNAMFWVQDRKPFMRLYGGSNESVVGSEASAAGAWAVYSGRYSVGPAGLVEARLNAGPIASAPVTTTINSGDRETIIGGMQTTGTYVGDIAEIAHYTRALTNAEWDEIVATLMAKYGIGT